MRESRNPIKIPTPPREAIGLVCSFRASGKSNSPFSSATRIIVGIAINEITNATDPVNNIFIILQGYGINNLVSCVSVFHGYKYGFCMTDAMTLEPQK